MWRGVVYLAVGTFAAAAALCAAVAWRLASGPIALPMATPYVTRAVNAAGGPTIRARTTELVWDREHHEPALSVRDVELASTTGVPLGVLPSLTVVVSLRALVRGVVAPVDITARGLALRVVLQPDGAVDLGVGAGAGQTFGSSRQAFADRLLGEPRASAAPTPLRAVVVHQASIEVVDAADRRSWRARDVELALAPGPSGLQLQLRGGLAFGETVVPVDVAAQARRDAGRVEVVVGFRGLDPSAASAWAPAGPPAVLDALAAVHLPLDGTVRLTLGRTLALRRARLRASSDRGSDRGSVHVSTLPRPVEVAHLRAAFAVDREHDRARLQLAGRVDAAAVDVHGRVQGLGNGGTADAGVRVTQVHVDDLERYWPQRAAPGARRWVIRHVRGGRVRRADAHLRGRIGEGGAGTLVGLHGTFALDGVTVRPLESLPPVAGVAGTGTFTDRSLRVDVARGGLGGMDVTQASVELPGAAPTRPGVAVDVALRGALGDALALVARLPGGDGGRGLSPADVAGAATVRVNVGVPLAAGARAGVATRVTAALTDVSLARLPRGWTFGGGDLAVDVADGAVAVRGRGQLQGVPVSLAGQGDLSGGPRTLDVSGDVGAPALAALGFGGVPAFAGDAAVQAHVLDGRRGMQQLTLDADLARVALDPSVPALRKRAGAPGHGHVVLTLANGAVTEMSDLRVELDATRLAASASLASGEWQRVDAAAVLQAPGGPPGHATLEVGPPGSKPRVTLASEDAGRLVAALGGKMQVAGGHMRFTGSWDGAAPGWPIDGQLEVGPFTLTRAPVLGRVASLISLSGVTKALARKKGLPFDRLTADLAQRAGVVRIASARASGTSLGIAVRGVVDWPAGTLALEGSLVPAYYGMNESAGRIPVLGKVLTGSGQEGFQVFDFTAKGSVGDPAVTARPSSAAPGAMRDVVRLLRRRPE